MENSEQIFTIALGIEAPWSIDKVSFNKDNSQLETVAKLKTKLNTLF